VAEEVAASDDEAAVDFSPRVFSTEHRLEKSSTTTT
jgi:hypothetical protein